VSTERRGDDSFNRDDAAWACIRTIIVPTGIAPVTRTSPVPFRKRTPLRKHPDGEATSRAGGREWFTERLFVEQQQGHKRAGYTASITVHVIVALMLMAAVLLAAEQPRVVNASASLVMPVLSVLPDIFNKVEPVTSRLPIEQPAPKAAAQPAVAAPAPPASASAQAPVDPPTDVAPETGAEPSGAGPKDGVDGGIEGGATGGVEGGIAGGAANGGAVGTSGTSSSGSPGQSGPIRSVTPPRKIKDVRPVYPQGALASQARGTVVIQATIGPDGKVKEAVVLRSVPGLDQAALDAVRQWEYAPTLLNGSPVAIILTIVVNFGIQ